MRVTLCDSEKGARGSFGMTMPLFPVLERAGADADEPGELGLVETGFLPNGPGIRPLQGGCAGSFLFAPHRRKHD